MSTGDTFTYPATRARSDARRAFLADTLSTAIEGGISYWASVRAYHVADPTLWETDTETNAYAEVRAEDNATWHVVTLDTMARGWSLYRGQTMSGADYGKQAMLANRTNGADGDYDADIADNVLQLGIFGEIIYG